MESLLSLFGGGAGAGAGASGGLSYLGGGQVNPSTIGTPGNGNPNFGQAQNGPTPFGNAMTQLVQNKMQGGGGAGGGGGGAAAGGMNASGGYLGGHF